MTSRIWNVTHSGVRGNITFDANGDRQVDFVLLDLDPEDNVYKVKLMLFFDALASLRSIMKTLSRVNNVNRVNKCQPY